MTAGKRTAAGGGPESRFSAGILHMDGVFDIYTEWLKIPAGVRPPDYYTLLGISPGEKDAAVIERAAMERMKVVRPRCLKFPEEGTDLLNEISAARICLVDRASRDEYERALAH